MNSVQSNEFLQLALEHWAAARFERATHEAWAAYRAKPQDLDSKTLLARLLSSFPGTIDADKKSDLLQLLQDREIAPEYISAAGWVSILRDVSWEAAANNGEVGNLAARLDDDKLGLALLRETPVVRRDAERVLTKIRRWLLLSGQWRDYRHLVDALAAQAILNGGAWPFDDIERTLLDQSSGPVVATYLPVRRSALMPRLDKMADPVTRAVSEDYERWPYPVWRRVMVGKRKRLPDVIRALDPGGPGCPYDAKILIAGCGTGRDAITVALEYPDLAVTAIDVSEASLHYARQQAAALNSRNIRFLNLDLRKISDLNERFDAIYCLGVLHHLPDPDSGWAALANVLRPGGVMKIAVYSRIARLWIAAARKLIGNFAPETINNDILRQVRQRIMDRADSWQIQDALNSDDFSTLAGTHDMLLHRHEDPFDISRISHALDVLGLRLLSFLLPTPDAYARYGTMFPQDPMHRDLGAWAKFEQSEPTIFSGMYEFWCRSNAVNTV